jgi:hypothetical protein
MSGAAAKRLEKEGFARSNVDWKGVTNLVQETYPGKVEVKKDQISNEKYITKIGNRSLEQPVPLNALGKNPDNKLVSTLEKNLLEKYQKASKSYYPPIQDETNFKRKKEKNLQKYGTTTPQYGNQRPGNNSQSQRDYEMYEEQKRMEAIRDQMLAQSRDAMTKGGFDPSRATFVQSAPRSGHYPTPRPSYLAQRMI